MANDDEQQESEARSSIDPALIRRVIELTKAVNENLERVAKRADKLLSRQNVLIGIFLLAMVLMVVNFFVVHKVYDCREDLRQVVR